MKRDMTTKTFEPIDPRRKVLLTTGLYGTIVEADGPDLRVEFPVSVSGRADGTGYMSRDWWFRKNDGIFTGGDADTNIRLINEPLGAGTDMAASATTRPLNMLPEDDAARLDFPMFDGLMAYFPNALAEVARVSKIGNDQHNPGQPMHWARNKSTDHGNKIMRHLVDAGGIDSKGVRHSARLAWRSLALLQEELEREEGLPPSRASKDRPW